MLLLVATLPAQSPLATRRLQPAGGPEIQVHGQAGPFLALRLSAPVPVELPEGAVELLQELARPAAEATARRFGARLELRSEDGRAVIAVSGPAAAFDALVTLLRRATSEPDLSRSSLARARGRAEDRVLARLEQPMPRIRRLLRYRLFGGPLPRGPAAGLLGPEAIRRLQEELYHPARLRIVLVGAVPDAVIRSAFADWTGDGRDPSAAGITVPDTAVTPARPQAHREWGGIAYAVPADPAVLAVTAELVRQRMRASALRSGAVEAWHQPGSALVLIGAVAPGDTAVRAAAGVSELAVRDSADVPAGDVRRYLRRLVAEAAALTGPAAVATARAAVRRQLLLEARTASGKAAVIDAIADRQSHRANDTEIGRDLDPAAFLGSLNDVDVLAVQALLTRVLATPAVVAEAR